MIGNPPYVRIQALKEWNPLEVEHYKRMYRAAALGNYDIYVVFVERALGLLAQSGQLGFIVPSKFLTTDYGEPLRELISGAKALRKLVDFGHELVFAGVSTYTLLLFLSRQENRSTAYLATDPYELRAAGNAIDNGRQIESSNIGSAPWLFQDDASALLIEKLLTGTVPLLSLPAQMSRGSSTGADDVFMLDVEEDRLCDRNGVCVDVEPFLLRTPLYATDFNRYVFRPKCEERVVFPYVVREDGYELISEARFRADFPKAFAYLRSKRALLEKRKQSGAWYGFSASRNLNLHDHASLVVPLLANRGMAAKLPRERERERESYCLMASGGFSITLADRSELTANYLLGLLNSKLLFWYLKRISNRFRGGWITCTKQYLGQMPIRFPISPQVQDRIAALVQDLIRLYADVQRAQSPDARTRLQRQIEIAEHQTDQAVYELYGLTDAEIAIVEAKGD